MTLDSALSGAPENSPGPSTEVENRPAGEWWRTAVIYQIYPRSFADAGGDGIGDLPGITSRLPSLATLGVDAIWLSPFMTSPQNDAGYDVADYCDVDPLFGTLADFDAMLERAHALGIRVIVDLVPNHSSSAHRWFQEALATPAGSAERARYLFRDGRGASGELPPNNWESVFGGPAWTRVTEPDGTPGQWYLHLFDTSQPDFDWTNEWVRERFREVLRFWLDRGVDGFRVDVAHGMIKAEGLPDYTPPADSGSMGGVGPDDDHPATAPYWAQDGVHEIYRDWHALLADYPGDRVLCAEAWVQPLSQLARWVRPDEMHQAFNFAYLETPWSGPALRDAIDASVSAFAAVGAPSTWVLSNHDVVRHASRLALTAENPQGYGIGPRTPGLPDPALGLRRARAATALMLALPGSAYLYQGEELGLPEAIDLPDSARQDPTWFRTGGERYGRDGCRVPIPWEADAPAYGFNATGASWLPQPSDWSPFARDSQEGVEGSTLELYRALLAVRRADDLGSGAVEWLDGYPDEVLAFRNGGITVIANVGSAPVELPVGSVVLSSEELREPALPADTTVWLRTD
ncbi:MULTISPECIES: glycoside hydrolase family 13 protein [unclassified Rathayibacter]|uniref:glycoside hydrolase family 13 protein n=1 Tax=unclassified Rathayibacter TaxID=2609250 RepID=UPI00188DAAC2|nr:MULTISPECIES: glycoside hydrolase family 13 protein [unclassified Rathayibacter]MBF4463325.1 glycoside hydrolase family 13 protein [Rathayibacter sp. VKM Ac-2879]MBF4504438.1 glycoside hydrolase family 13 protein [Rathayibacter sp. VKM Ac-2878]